VSRARLGLSDDGAPSTRHVRDPPGPEPTERAEGERPGASAHCAPGPPEFGHNPDLRRRLHAGRGHQPGSRAPAFGLPGARTVPEAAQSAHLQAARRPPRAAVTGARRAFRGPRARPSCLRLRPVWPALRGRYRCPSAHPGRSRSGRGPRLFPNKGPDAVGRHGGRRRGRRSQRDLCRPARPAAAATEPPLPAAPRRRPAPRPSPLGTPEAAASRRKAAAGLRTKAAVVGWGGGRPFQSAAAGRRLLTGICLLIEDCGLIIQPVPRRRRHRRRRLQGRGRRCSSRGGGGGDAGGGGAPRLPCSERLREERVAEPAAAPGANARAAAPLRHKPTFLYPARRASPGSQSPSGADERGRRPAPADVTARRPPPVRTG
jgi:hypothetical protein